MARTYSNEEIAQIIHDAGGPKTTYAERILRQAADTLKQRGQVYDLPARKYGPSI